MTGGNALLRLQAVTKVYDGVSSSGEEVLKGVDLEISEGQSVAIIGPSGSGKSTLLNIMGTLDEPTTGTVTFDGQDVAGLRGKTLARMRNERIGFVFQLHHLLPQCTIMENVLIPSLVHSESGRAPERARRLLDRVGLSHRLWHRPGQLSGGECQRVAVVRALINGPRILLADEPTGSLDREGAESLCRLLVEMNREESVALVTVTHSPRLAEQMVQMYELRDGVLG